MKLILRLIIFSILLAVSQLIYAQNDSLLQSLPTTKDGFIKSERAVINTIDWLENTPLNKHKDERNQLTNLLSAWLVSSPTVTILTQQEILAFTKANSKLLIIFMGGWTKYSLQNNYSTDTVKCMLAGIESAIKVYKMGKDIKSDKEMDKLIAMQSKSELEDWIRKKIRQ